MRNILGLIAAVSLFLSLFGAGSALATHKGKEHQRPPACEISQGQAPDKNKHCYPPAESPATEEGRAFGPDLSDGKPPPGSSGGGITVGMAALAAAGAMGVGLAALGLRARSRRKAVPAPS